MEITTLLKETWKEDKVGLENAISSLKKEMKESKIAILIIIVAFLLLGGRSWLDGMMHNHRSLGIDSLNWLQIVISLGIGFVLGVLYSRNSRRKLW